MKNLHFLGALVIVLQGSLAAGQNANACAEAKGRLSFRVERSMLSSSINGRTQNLDLENPTVLNSCGQRMALAVDPSTAHLLCRSFGFETAEVVSSSAVLPGYTHQVVQIKGGWTARIETVTAPDQIINFVSCTKIIPN